MLIASSATWTTKPLAVPLISPTPTPTPAPHGNPASIYCTQVSGTLTIQKNGAGTEYGLCTFLDNRSCEETALYRGDCPVGGVKTTGYITEAQKYCAWMGGRTISTAHAICTFADGSTCDDEALFMGTCSKGNTQ